MFSQHVSTFTLIVQWSWHEPKKTIVMIMSWSCHDHVLYVPWSYVIELSFQSMITVWYPQLVHFRSILLHFYWNFFFFQYHGLIIIPILYYGRFQWGQNFFPLQSHTKMSALGSCTGCAVCVQYDVSIHSYILKYTHLNYILLFLVQWWHPKWGVFLWL